MGKRRLSSRSTESRTLPLSMSSRSSCLSLSSARSSPLRCPRSMLPSALQLSALCCSWTRSWLFSRLPLGFSLSGSMTSPLSLLRSSSTLPSPSSSHGPPPSRSLSSQGTTQLGTKPSLSFQAGTGASSEPPPLFPPPPQRPLPPSLLYPTHRPPPPPPCRPSSA